MPHATDKDKQILRLHILGKIGKIAPQDWDRCCEHQDPYVSHSFLKALEASGSVSPNTGFRAHHLLLQNQRQQTLAAAPVYLRHHAYAGHGLDPQWHEIHKEQKLRYFPNFNLAPPYMPTPGPRLLAPKGPQQSFYKERLVRGLTRLGQQRGLSSVHCSFLNTEDKQIFERHGYVFSQTLQNIWHNLNYRDFEDFLSHLRQRKRTNTRAERKQLRQRGIQIRRFFGPEITPDLWRLFYRFHQATNQKFGTQTYLHESFFHRLGDALGDQVYLALAYEEGQPIAGTVNIVAADYVFPRYWGSLVDIEMLHFECSYYQAMEFAIEQGLKWVEVGDGGEQKLRRGFRPEISYNAHLFFSPRVKTAVDEMLRLNQQQIKTRMKEAEQLSPYRE